MTSMEIKQCMHVLDIILKMITHHRAISQKQRNEKVN